MTVWRGIESAPRDGTHVLLWGKQLPHEAVFVDVPLVFVGYWDSIDEAWCSVGSTWSGPFYAPTDWAESPPPPDNTDV